MSTNWREKEIRRSNMLRAIDELESIEGKVDLALSALREASGDDPNGNLNIIEINTGSVSHKEMSFGDAEGALQGIVDIIKDGRPVTREDLQSWWSEHIGRDYIFPG